MATSELEMPRAPKRNDLSAKIAADIHRKAGVIAEYRGMPLAKFLSDLLREPVDVEYQKMTKDMAKGKPPAAKGGQAAE
jgi:hypothetical protein